MLFRTYFGGLLCVVGLLVAGCSSDAESATALADTANFEDDCDAGECEDDDDSDVIRPSAFAETGVPTGLPSFATHAMPVLQAHCSECHIGNESGECAGGTCFADNYDLAMAPGCCSEQLPFGTCAGDSPTTSTTIGWCMLYRIVETATGGPSGQLLFGGKLLLVPQVDIDVLRAWLDAGSPQ